MGANTKIGTITTVNGVGNTYSASSSGSTVQLSYPANALPANTVIDIYLLSDTTRADSLLPGDKSFVLNIVTAWLAADGTVPDTAAGKPITVTITNSAIKKGARAYALLGETVTDLGVATVDGSVTVEITEDPEIVVVVTKPDAPTGVSAKTTANSATITWSAPAVSGGAAVTAYVATAATGQTCSSSGTTCTITGLSPSTSYSFTVKATNAVGTSLASSPSAAVSTPVPASGRGRDGGEGGGGRGGAGSSSAPAAPAADPVEKKLDEVAAGIEREFKPVAPSRPVKDTGVIATEDGNGPKPVAVRNETDDKVLVRGTGWELAIGAAKSDGKPNPLTSDYAISARELEKVVASGSGLAPNTWVDLYVFSDPVFVGTVETDSSGSFVAEFAIPSGLAFGAHTLILGTKNLADETITIKIQLNVRAKVKTLSSSIVFAEDSAALTGAAESKLLGFIAKQENRKVLKITIAGFGAKDSSGRYTDALALERGEKLAAFFRQNGLDVRVIVSDAGLSKYEGAKARKVTTKSFWRKLTS
jgi:hypothetical protein